MCPPPRRADIPDDDEFNSEGPNPPLPLDSFIYGEEVEDELVSEMVRAMLRDSLHVLRPEIGNPEDMVANYEIDVTFIEDYDDIIRNADRPLEPGTIRVELELETEGEDNDETDDDAGDADGTTRTETEGSNVNGPSPTE